MFADSQRGHLRAASGCGNFDSLARSAIEPGRIDAVPPAPGGGGGGIRGGGN